MGKSRQRGNKEKALERAYQVCDEADDVAGDKAPATTVLAARLLCGSEETFDHIIAQSIDSIDWKEVAKIHAENTGEGEDGPGDDDEDEDEPFVCIAGGRK